MADTLRFHDGRFKIMQAADLQEIPHVSPDTLRLLDLALEREKPDLVILTGDQIYGPLPFFRFGDTENAVRRTIRTLLRPLTDRRVPFAVTFGNHDRESGIPNADQAEMYFSLPGCIRPAYRSEHDKGSFLLTVAGENGQPKLNLLVFDSNGQGPAGGYLPVSAEQLEWFRETRDRQAAALGKFLPTLAFQHIPVPEYYNVLKKVGFGTKGAVEAFRTRKHEFYTLPEPIRRAGGFLGESPAIPDRNSGEFALLKESGVLALFVGHDHNNSFEASLDGVRLFYTQGAGFHAYGPHRRRGVRIIELCEDDVSAFTSRVVTFDDLTGEPLHAPLLEFTLTHIPTSMEQVKRLALLGAGAAAFCAAGAAVCLAGRKKN